MSTSHERPASSTLDRELSDLLIAVAREQDRAAFTALFDHFAPRVKSYLLRGGASPQQAEELVQDTFLLVWRKAAFFDPARGGASTWIFTIARNRRADALRRERHPELVPDEERQPAAAPDAELLMAAAQREERVRAALGTLSADHATVIRLSYFDDKAQSEIARELAIPLGTVKSRVRLAMTRLRALLGDL